MDLVGDTLEYEAWMLLFLKSDFIGSTSFVELPINHS